MANYVGYFSDLHCKQYEVKITSNENSSDYQEILLAGEQPFVVRYNTSNTPFDPVRTSTATVNIVHDDYLEDSLSSCAQGTKIELNDITNSASPITEWVGYLTPKIYDAGYVDCFENFSLEAADCISSLQYVDYVETNSGGVVNIKSVIAQICDAANELEGFYWTKSKKYDSSDGDIILPEHLAICEHNFQSNDTNEEWKLSEVLEEICRYLGYTCLQWGKRMYFVDYQWLETHNSLTMSWYPKYNGYNRVNQDQTIGSAYTVTSGSVMSNDASISFEPIYNKVTVNANMYAAEDVVPNIFDDKFLRNRINSGDFYTNVEITPDQSVAEYPHGGEWYTIGFTQKYVKEKGENENGKKVDLYDNKYRYFMRLYDHKFYDSYYTNALTGTYAPLSDNQKASSDVTKDYRGATIVDLGVVRNEYKDQYQNWIVPSKLDYTRYLCVCEKYVNPQTGRTVSSAIGYRTPVFKLKSGYKPMVMVDDKSYLVLYCNAIFERYENRNYINPEWNSTECKTNWSAAGYYRNQVGQPVFKIHVGNLGWSTWRNGWVTANSSDDYVVPEMKWESNKKDFCLRQQKAPRKKAPDSHYRECSAIPVSHKFCHNSR